MPTNTSTAKLSYIAIMLLAAGCLLLYVVRSNSDPKGTAANPVDSGAAQVARGTAGPSSDSVLITGDGAAIEKAIEGGMDVNSPLKAPPYARMTPLHVAALRAIAGSVPILAAAGANVDAQTADGRTPLMVAAEQGWVSGASDLIAANASIDMRDALGRTALMLAAGSGKTGSVQTLLKAGAAINAADSSGATAVAHAATLPANTAIIALLVSAGADPDVADAQGVTPLMKAAERTDTEQVVALLNAGASPKARSKDGRSALDRTDPHG